MNQRNDHPESAPEHPPEVTTAHASEVQAALTHLPRRAIVGAAALAAVGAGVFTAWMRNRQPEAPAVTDAVPTFWDLAWKTPTGAELAMRSFKEKPLLLNFWATWCPPCVEELPLINAFSQNNKVNGWQVLGLAVDKPLLVQAFLSKMPLDFAVAMAGFDGTELSRKLGNLTGGLPFSVALDGAGRVIQRKMGRLDANDLTLLGGLK